MRNPAQPPRHAEPRPAPLAHTAAEDCDPGLFNPSTVQSRLQSELAENLYRMWLDAIAGVRLTDAEFGAVQPVVQADLVRHVHVTLAATRRAKTVLGLAA